MRCVVEPDLTEFAERVRPFLLAHRYEANVILTVLHGRLADPDSTQPPVVGAYAVGADGAVVGVSLRTPPLRALVSPMPLAAVAAIEEALADVDPDAPGVHGPTAQAARFAGLRAARGCRRVRPGMAQRLYVLGDLAPPADIPGAARPATEADVPLVGRWWAAFADEAVPGSAAGDAERAARARLRGGAMHLWEAGAEPVAMAGYVGPFEGIARVAPVYTPPRHRRHGYGSAVTAACSAHALAAGADAVLLYTDLANPTSNAIYRWIGYRPVADAHEFHLDPVGTVAA